MTMMSEVYSCFFSLLKVFSINTWAEKNFNHQHTVEVDFLGSSLHYYSREKWVKKKAAPRFEHTKVQSTHSITTWLFNCLFASWIKKALINQHKWCLITVIYEYIYLGGWLLVSVTDPLPTWESWIPLGTRYHLPWMRGPWQIGQCLSLLCCTDC